MCIFVVFLYNLPLDKKERKTTEGYYVKHCAGKIIIVMHSTDMIIVPALLSLDIFRKEEECKHNIWWGSA